METRQEFAAGEHVLDQASFLSPTGEHAYRGQTSAAYANMVGPFGGVIGATLLNAAMLHPGRIGEPLSLTVHYAAPIADGDYVVSARPLRTNRTTQHWHIELSQNAEVAAFASAVFAIRRDTWSATEAVFPDAPPAAKVAVTPPHPRAAWTRQYEMRFIRGAPSAMDMPEEKRDSESLLWIRDQPPRPLDFLSLSAICDAFYPRLFVRRPRWVPIGTVALTTYFHATAAQLAAQGSRPVLGCARAQHFGQGYFDQTAQVWGDDGRLLAVSHQVVYFKE
jgi:acyl-CoA thioesterase